MQINQSKAALVAPAAPGDRNDRNASRASACANVLLPALIMIVIVMTACRGSGPDGQVHGAVMMSDVHSDALRASEFSIEVIVRAGDGRTELHAGVENRPGHYVLLADGSLHAGSLGRWMPPRRRVLMKDELAIVHSALRVIDEASQRTHPRRVERETPADRVLSIAVDVRTRDEAWMVSRTYGPGDAVDREMAGLVRRLAALSWMPDVEPEGQPLAPRRYDLGPDPYARYRPAARGEGS